MTQVLRSHGLKSTQASTESAASFEAIRCALILLPHWVFDFMPDCDRSGILQEGPSRTALVPFSLFSSHPSLPCYKEDPNPAMLSEVIVRCSAETEQHFCNILSFCVDSCVFNVSQVKASKFATSRNIKK